MASNKGDFTRDILVHLDIDDADAKRQYDNFKETASKHGVNIPIDVDDKALMKVLKDIKRIIKDNDVQFLASIDKKNLVNQVAKIAPDIAKVFNENVHMDLKASDIVSAFKQIQQEAEKTEKATKKALTNDGTKANNAARDSYKQLTNDAKKYYELRIQKEQQGQQFTASSAAQLDALEAKWKELNAAVEKYTVNANGSTASQAGYQNASGAFSEKSLQLAREYADELDTTRQKLEAMGGSGKYVKELSQEMERLAQEIQKINSEKIDLNTDATIRDIARIRNESQNLFDKAALADYKQAQESTLNKLRAKLEKIAADNSAMGAKLTQQWKNIKLNLDTADSKQQVNELAGEIAKLEANIYAAGKAGKSFGQQFSERLRGIVTGQVAQFFSFMDIARYTKNAVDTIKDLDYELVDLRKTSSMTTSQLNDFYYTSNDVAKQMGVTTKEIISQASAWSRLGFSTGEAATEMAKLSSQFAAISPGMTTDTAQSGLVSLMKAYSLDVDQVERELMDNINQLGNRFALSNEDIISGMERAAAALSATGTSLQDSLALFTGGKFSYLSVQKCA